MDNSNAACSELKEFLKDDIPLVEPKEETFLNIINREHHENIWSNLYAFFFDPEGKHGLGRLFVTSFLELIPQKANSLTLGNSITVKREVSTKDKKRLDLAIYLDNSAILIENKVLHKLDNDLQNYWSSCKKKNKEGVVLSLYPVAIKSEDEANWINITHKMFMDKVMNNFKKLDVDKSDKYVVILNDFYINICNVTSSMDKNKIDFCFDNISMVEKVTQLRNHVYSGIKASIRSGAKQFNLTADEKERASCIYYKTGDKELMYTILYDKLFTESKSIKIIIELNGGLIDKYKEHEKEIPFTDKERELFTNHFDEKHSFWMHVAVIEVCNLSNDNILDIPNFISRKITEDTCLSSIFNKIRTFKNSNT